MKPPSLWLLALPFGTAIYAAVALVRWVQRRRARRANDQVIARRYS